MGRAAGDVFRDHLSAVNSGDIQTILMDYAEDAQILTAQGALKGREGVEALLHSGVLPAPRSPDRRQTDSRGREQSACVVECIVVCWTH